MCPAADHYNFFQKAAVSGIAIRVEITLIHPGILLDALLPVLAGICTERWACPYLRWFGRAFGCPTLNSYISQRYCWAVRLLASLSFRGHWKEPDSRCLYSSTNPLPSQYNVLIRSRRLPQNKNNVLLNGSNWNSCWTMAASPSIPGRRSV